MRIEATVGPVTLVFEREKAPVPGQTFKVAVFVADRAKGTAIVTYQDWVAFCQAAPAMRSSP